MNEKTREYFSHDNDALNDPKIVKMMLEYNYEGYGYFWAIVEQLNKQKDYKYAFNDLIAMSKTMSVDLTRLKQFIEDCCSDKFTHNEQALFNRNDKHFWSDSHLRRMDLKERKRLASRLNGQLGGRPPLKPETPPADEPQEPEKYLKFPEVEYINLTQIDYDRLVKRHTEAKTLKAIELYNDWIGKNGSAQLQKIFKSKSAYNYFRADKWIWKTTDDVLKAEGNNNAVNEEYGRY